MGIGFAYTTFVFGDGSFHAILICDTSSFFIFRTTTMDDDVLGGLLEKYAESSTMDDGRTSELVRNAESTSSAGL